MYIGTIILKPGSATFTVISTLIASLKGFTLQGGANQEDAYFVKLSIIK